MVGCRGDNLIELVLYFFIGCIGGFFSGLLGIGGGVVLIPLLIYLGNVDIKIAATISMIFIIFASLSGIIGHLRFKNIIIRLGLLMGFGSIIGSYSTSYLTVLIPEYMLVVIFIIVIFMAIAMLYFNKHNLNTAIKMKKNDYLIIILGMFQGALTGMLGVGGGFVIVPMMSYFFGISIHYAVGTSLIVIFISAIAGILGRISILNLPLEPVWLLIIAAMPCAQLGCWIASKLEASYLRFLFLFMLFIILISMVYELCLYI